MDLPEIVSPRLRQLSFLATLSLLLLQVVSLLANYMSSRIVKEGATIISKPVESPLRYVGFLIVAVFFGACIITKTSLKKREFAVIVALLLTEVFANRLSDFSLAFTWQSIALILGILWHRVPLHPKIFSWTCWLFFLINAGTTIMRPSWAFSQIPGQGGLAIGRLVACTAHPNELGLVSAVYALIVLLHVRTKGWKFLFLGLMALLLLSESKTALFCLIVASGCYFMKWRMRPWVAVLVPIFSIVYGFLAASGFIFDDALSLTGRTNLWSVLINAVGRSPIIGSGPTGVEDATKYARVGFYVGNHAHDAALQVLVDGGMVGYLAYCIFVYSFARTANRSYLGSALFIFTLIHSFSESTLPWLWPFPLCYAASFTLTTMQKDLRAAIPVTGRRILRSSQTLPA